MVIYEGTDGIALAFDDGPNPKVTPKILSVLKDKGVKATFFLIGRKAEVYPEIVKQIIDEGHDIGNHSYTHKPLAKLLQATGKDAVLEEIQKSANVLKKIANITDKELQFFRPPYLDWDEEVALIAKPIYGDRIIVSSTAHGDYAWGSNHTWDDSDLEGITNQAQIIVTDWEQSKPGTVVALHDGAEYDLPGNPTHPTWMNRALPTLQALPTIIDNIQNKNLAIRKLSEMDLKTEPLRTQ
jgi:peptidoglycan/xylan/chitin deacetylase (PgdA/CDA1 family)